jgi:hypothetical protein
MPHRQFTDPHGVTWEVWDVQPEHLGSAPGQDPPDKHKTPMSAELVAGWLCFQHDTDRRRFYPIPPHWQELPDSVLRVILEVSDAVKASDPLPPPPTTSDPSGPSSVSLQ